MIHRLIIMLDTIPLNKVLVLDIETVSGHHHYTDLSSDLQELWDIKAQQIQNRLPEEARLPPAESYVEKAGIYAEFGKIVCISVGFFSTNKEDDALNFHLRSYYSHDERELLTGFAELIEKTRGYYICGHNIKEFDIPYICRRMIINQLPMPEPLQLHGKKPWEMNHLLDTMTLWKFGDYKNYTSLKLLCGVFGIPSPKSDIDGSEVGKTYWGTGDLDRIETYCKNDVLATARLLMAYKRMPLIEDERVIYK